MIYTNNKSKKSIIFLLTLLLLFSFYYFTNNKDNSSYAFSDKTSTNILKVHFLDVGQGDSIFIELPNKKTILIDAGEKEYSSVISSYINNLNYKKINYLVGTHPHSDHIGGLADIINNFNIDYIYMPKVINNTRIYENLLDTIAKHNLTINQAKAGVNLLKENNLNISFIAPNSEKYTNINNYSAVMKIIYGNNIFLFMGDAEKESEDEIKENVKADVIKIAHHGSNSSSSISFIKRVNAQYGIISVGKNNIYNLPSNKVINNWEERGTKIYRTDEYGSIIVSSDGNSINVEGK